MINTTKYHHKMLFSDHNINHANSLYHNQPFNLCCHVVVPIPFEDSNWYYNWCLLSGQYISKLWCLPETGLRNELVVIIYYCHFVEFHLVPLQRQNMLIAFHLISRKRHIIYVCWHEVHSSYIYTVMSCII